MTTDASSGDPKHGSIPDSISVDVAPTEMTSTIKGTGNRVLDTPEMGDKIVALVELEAASLGFEALEKGTRLKVVWKMHDLFVVPHDEGRARLKKARSEHRVGVAEAKGEHPFVGFGDVGYTDESGVVLTDAEVADRRGLGLPVLEVSPAVVVFADESRSMWPDEFAKGDPRPSVGEVWAGVVVARLLDPATGEPLEVVEAEIVDDDDWMDPEFPLDGAAVAQRELDEAAVSFVDGTIPEVKLRVKGQISQQMLRQALGAEVAGRDRAGVVEAIKARIDELAGS